MKNCIKKISAQISSANTPLWILWFYSILWLDFHAVWDKRYLERFDENRRSMFQFLLNPLPLKSLIKCNFKNKYIQTFFYSYFPCCSQLISDFMHEHEQFFSVQEIRKSCLFFCLQIAMQKKFNSSRKQVV